MSSCCPLGVAAEEDGEYCCTRGGCASCNGGGGWEKPFPDLTDPFPPGYTKAPVAEVEVAGEEASDASSAAERWIGSGPNCAFCCSRTAFCMYGNTSSRSFPFAPDSLRPSRLLPPPLLRGGEGGDEGTARLASSASRGSSIASKPSGAGVG